MATNDYHFITRWRFEATAQEVNDVLDDAADLVRWWPDVYLAVEQLEDGDVDGVGKVYRLYTRGRLPYTLTWYFRVTESRKPYGWTLDAWGDFAGRGTWTFEEDGPYVDVTYDWRVRADKPLLRYLSSLLKPIFAANHHWAMARGEERLRQELTRRRSEKA